MTKANQGRRPPGGPTGIGLGLRWDFAREAMGDGGAELPDALAFFEFSPENYMRRGGFHRESLERVAQRRPLRTHGLAMNLGGIELDERYLDQLDATLNALGVDAHSDHLCWSGHGENCWHELLPLVFSLSNAKRVAENICRARDRIRRPLAVENVSYYGAWARPGEATRGEELAARELEFLHAVLDHADCGLLLDVNNLHVNATNHGFDAMKFLRQVPLHRVESLHVAGGERRADWGGLLIDTHAASVSSEVVELMQFVLRRIGPAPVLYERDGKIPGWTQLCAEVEALDRAYAEALATPVDALAAVAARGERTPPERLELETGNGEVDEAHARMSSWIRRPAAEVDVHSDPPRLSLDALACEVYRSLPRDGLRGPVEAFLARTRARLDLAQPGRFDADFDAWLAQRGPRSFRLRDIPREFQRFAREGWRRDLPELPWLEELADHELLEYEVAALPDDPFSSRPERFALDLRLRLTSSAQVARYRHAIHELPHTLGDDDAPAPTATTLIVYRDAHHQIHRLRLRPLGDALARQLAPSETTETAPIAPTVEEALRHAAGELEAELDAAWLERAAEFFAVLSAHDLLRLADLPPPNSR